MISGLEVRFEAQHAPEEVQWPAMRTVTLGAQVWKDIWKVGAVNEERLEQDQDFPRDAAPA
jgi:hypothetical protein